MLVFHNSSNADLKTLEARFAPINAAARRGTYMEALGDSAETAIYLNESTSHALVQTVLHQLRMGMLQERRIALGKLKDEPKPRPGAQARPTFKPFKPR